jgi:hypothetical protein
MLRHMWATGDLSNPNPLFRLLELTADDVNKIINLHDAVRIPSIDVVQGDEAGVIVRCA